MFFVQNVLQLGIIRYSTLSFNLTVFTFIMIYIGMNQSVIYKYEKERADVQILMGQPRSKEAKYLGSALNDKEVSELMEMVLHYLSIKKPYLNPEYSLQMMVDDLNIPRHKLSQVINRSQKKNFYKLINEYRVKEVKEKLQNKEYKNLTVLGIAFESGFNSKTTFNRIFKEETGMTPTHFIKEI